MESKAQECKVEKGEIGSHRMDRRDGSITSQLCRVGCGEQLSERFSLIAFSSLLKRCKTNIHLPTEKKNQEWDQEIPQKEFPWLVVLTLGSNREQQNQKRKNEFS